MQGLQHPEPVSEEAPTPLNSIDPLVMRRVNPELIRAIASKLNPRVIGTADPVERILVELASGTGELSEIELMRHLTADRINSPRVLHTAWRHGRVNESRLREHLLPFVWSWAGSPQAKLGNEEWLQMFDAVGYCSNGKPATPPDGLRLFRGAPASFRHNWSWTDQATVAQAWVRTRHPQSGKVWTTVPPSEAFLMHSDGRRYVVRADLLDVREATAEELHTINSEEHR